MNAGGRGSGHHLVYPQGRPSAAIPCALLFSVAWAGPHFCNTPETCAVLTVLLCVTSAGGERSLGGLQGFSTAFHEVRTHWKLPEGDRLLYLSCPVVPQFSLQLGLVSTAQGR